MIFIQIIIPLDITLIVTEIPNGIYFIENKETAKCIDIQNQVMADGTQIHGQLIFTQRCYKARLYKKLLIMLKIWQMNHQV